MSLKPAFQAIKKVLINPRDEYPAEGIVGWIDRLAGDQGHNFEEDAKSFFLLHAAAATGNTVVALRLLELKADPLQQDQKKQTPLLIAAQNGHLEFAQTMKETLAQQQKIDPHEKLILLIRLKSHRDIATLLRKECIAHCATYFLYRNRQQPLHYAAEFPNNSITGQLLTYGADPLAVNAKGHIPFVCAVEKNVWQTANVLAEATLERIEKLMELLERQHDLKLIQLIALLGILRRAQQSYDKQAVLLELKLEHVDQLFSLLISNYTHICQARKPQSLRTKTLQASGVVAAAAAASAKRHSGEQKSKIR